jgi:hypothetical protein
MIRDFIALVFVFGVIVYGIPFAHLAITGEYLSF